MELFTRMPDVLVVIADDGERKFVLCKEGEEPRVVRAAEAAHWLRKGGYYSKAQEFLQEACSCQARSE